MLNGEKWCMADRQKMKNSGKDDIKMRDQ